MAVALDDLLKPVSEDDPVGPDLAYDSGRYEIEQAFESAVSIDASGVEAQAADVDWRSIISKIVAQSAKTKDVWLAVYLTRAGARSNDLETTQIGAEYLAGLLETYWPTVHPQLEEYGVQGRKGPCDSLAGLPQFLTPLMRMRILKHPRLGEFSTEDFDRFRANGGEQEDGYGMFRAAIEDTGQAGLEAIAERVDAIHAAVKRADLVLTSNAEDGGATNFAGTYATLAQMKKSVMAFGAAPTEPEDAEEEVGAEAASGETGGGGGSRISGRVETREDVMRALEAIGDYYRRKEPGHPMVMLLGRAREWVSSDFIAILKDIAPTSLDEARNVLLSRTQRETP